MKSGKSFDLISHFSPLSYTTTRHALFQPQKNVRDEGIASRSGLFLAAQKIHSLKDINLDAYDVIGLDEVHMFNPHEVRYLRSLLTRDTDIIACGLDTDYKGEMFEIIKKLLELGPSNVTYKRAVCAGCKAFTATHTQVYREGKPLTGGMPSVIPEDGTFEYEPVCRNCFVYSVSPSRHS